MWRAEKELHRTHWDHDYREREREARVHLVAQPAVHDLNQRDVGFRDRFVEPVLLQKPVMLRMPYEWQVRVENE